MCECVCSGGHLGVRVSLFLKISLSCWVQVEALRSDQWRSDSCEDQADLWGSRRRKKGNFSGSIVFLCVCLYDSFSFYSVFIFRLWFLSLFVLPAHRTWKHFTHLRASSLVFFPALPHALVLFLSPFRFGKRRLLKHAGPAVHGRAWVTKGCNIY